MSNSNEHNELDQFLRDKFEGHTIEPTEELWEGIEQQFAPRVISIHKYSRLKIVLYSSAVVIAGLIVMLFHSKNEKSNLPIISNKGIVEKLPETKTVPSENKVFENPVNSMSPENLIKNKSLTETRKGTERISKTKNQGNTPLDIMENVNGNTPYNLTQIHSIRVNNIGFLYQYKPESLRASTLPVKKTEIREARKPAHSNFKFHRAVNPLRPRHISAKRYYAQKSKNKELIKLGKFFDNFDLRANVSPMLTTRSLNNLQNVSDMDYDREFYDETESNRVLVNGGLELAYNINPHWEIYSGIKLSRYAQKIQNAQDRYLIISSDQVIIPSSAGNIIVNGNNIGQLPAQSLFKTKIKLQFLEIPLIARYHLNQNFYFDAGLKYGCLLADKTSVSLNDKNVDFSVEKINGLKKNNFGLVLGIGLDHVTRAGIRFELGPEINLGFNNLNPTAGVVSKSVSFGIRTGIFFGKYKQM